MLAEQVDGQITLGRADHHSGNDPVTRICIDVGTLSATIAGRCRDISVHPVRERVDGFSFNRFEVKRVPRAYASYRIAIDAPLKVPKILSHGPAPCVEDLDGHDDHTLVIIATPSDGVDVVGNKPVR